MKKQEIKDKSSKTTFEHGFEAVVNRDSEILILGSFPSVISRKLDFYYMNPQNRFWSVLTSIYNYPFDTSSIAEKKRLLKHCRIALYDVCECCSIIGSQDALISSVIPLNLEKILSESNIKHIYLNGKTAYRLFIKYFKTYQDVSFCLPSTSSANARFSLQALVKEWNIIKE